MRPTTIGRNPLRSELIRPWCSQVIYTRTKSSTTVIVSVTWTLKIAFFGSFDKATSPPKVNVCVPCMRRCLSSHPLDVCGGICVGEDGDRKCSGVRLGIRWIFRGHGARGTSPGRCPEVEKASLTSKLVVATARLFGPLSRPAPPLGGGREAGLYRGLEMRTPWHARLGRFTKHRHPRSSPNSEPATGCRGSGEGIVGRLVAGVLPLVFLLRAAPRPGR